MRILSKKITAIFDTNDFLTIPSISSGKTLDPPHKIRSQLEKKNPDLYKKTDALIKNYISKAKKQGTPHFDEALLWQLSSIHKNSVTFSTFIDFDQKLLSIFNNPQDLLLFCSSPGLKDVIQYFCIDQNRAILLQRFKPLELLKIMNSYGACDTLSILVNDKHWHRLNIDYGLDISKILKISSKNGAHQILALLLDPKNWDKLTQLYKLDLNNIVRLATHTGSYDTLKLILNPKKWQTLTKNYQLNVQSIVKISNHNGASHVFNLLLKKSNWHLLTTVYKLSIENIVRISNHTGARQIWDALLKKKNWKILTELYQLDIHEIVKLSDCDGARKALDTLLNPKNWERLTKVYKIDKNGIIKIASKTGARKTLDLLLDPKKWETLTKVYGLSIEGILKISGYSGASNVFEILLDFENWQTLTETYQLNTNDIIRISAHMGARNSLKSILNKKNWQTLTDVYKFDPKDIAKISCKVGSGSVLNTLLNPKHWKTLTDVCHLKTSDIIKIVNYDNSNHVLDIFLDPNHWKTLTERYRFDVNNLIRISNNNRSKYIFNLLLKSDTWKTLTKDYKLDPESILKIVSHFGSSYVLTTLLDKKNWETLTKVYQLKVESIVNIANHENSNNTFQILLKPQNWKLFTQDYGIDVDTLVSISSRPQSANKLEILLDPHKYYQLCSIFGKKLFLKLARLRRLSYSLDYFIQQHKYFQKYFDNNYIKTILQLPLKDQKGLLTALLSPLKKSLHFNQENYIFLTKLSGRHLPYIFNLIYTSPDMIASLFCEGGLPLHEPKELTYRNKTLNLLDKDGWVLTLTELHHYCIETPPLSLEQLFFLKTLFPPILPAHIRLARLKYLIYSSEKMVGIDRLTIWKSTQKRNWAEFDFFNNSLNHLPIHLQKWFNSKGLNKIHQIVKSESINDSKLLFNVFDRHCLSQCLKNVNIRTYIERTFSRELEIPPWCPPANYTFTTSTSKKYPSLITGPQLLTLLDWLRFILMAYKFIDTEIDCLDRLQKAPPQGSIHLPIEYLSNFKEKYPSFHFQNNTIFSPLPSQILKIIIANMIPPKSTRTPQKRSASDSPQICTKKVCLTENRLPFPQKDPSPGISTPDFLANTFSHPSYLESSNWDWEWALYSPDDETHSVELMDLFDRDYFIDNLDSDQWNFSFDL